MAVFPVKIFGDPVLREKSQRIEVINAEIEKLAHNMAMTMYAQAGIGLAAPQIGVLKQIIVVDVGEDNFVVYANPVIKERGGGEDVDDEGCLCLPDIKVPVKRAKKISFEAFDLKGRKIELEADDLLARILQHELDHLEGLTILDRTDAASKQKAIKEFMSEQRNS